jgi:hypothetical protein
MQVLCCTYNRVHVPIQENPSPIPIPRHGKSKYLHFQITCRQKRTISKCLFPFPIPTTSPAQPICLSCTTIPLDGSCDWCVHSSKNATAVPVSISTNVNPVHPPYCSLVPRLPKNPKPGKGVNTWSHRNAYW